VHEGDRQYACTTCVSQSGRKKVVSPCRRCMRGLVKACRRKVCCCQASGNASAAAFASCLMRDTSGSLPALPFACCNLSSKPGSLSIASFACCPTGASGSFAPVTGADGDCAAGIGLSSFAADPELEDARLWEACLSVSGS